jgi:phytoene synthase
MAAMTQPSTQNRRHPRAGGDTIFVEQNNENPAVAGVTLSYAEALADVKARVARSRTSFGPGMAVLPRERREAMYALYAFCREVDDIADDGLSEEQRHAELAQWRGWIRDLFQHGHSVNAITCALQPAITRFVLQEQDFQDIIDGMAMDAGAPIVAPTMAVLDLYCDRVASAVGRASVRIFGDASADALQVAYHLGRALQLTNILRDIAEDAARGRLYLPQELLVKHSIAADPATITTAVNLPLLCRELAVKADEHFTAANAAMRRCNQAAMKPARLMRDYYFAIYQRLLKTDWQDMTRRVSLPKWQKLWLATRLFLR